MVDVSIGIVTYSSERVIERCLESVAAQAIKNFEVLVVDNNSQDRTVEIVRRNFPQVKLVQNIENIGFGRAHNMAIARSEGKFYLALNHDAVLARDYLMKLVRILEDDTTVGSVMGQVIYMDENSVSTGVVYSMGHVLSPALQGLSLNNGLQQAVSGTGPMQVFGVNAACALYRKKMLEEVAFEDGEYFDRLYFMYYEDVDLDWRAWNRGWKAICVPDAVAFHISGAAKNYRDWHVRAQATANEYMTLMKNVELSMLIAVLPYYLLNWAYNLFAHPRRMLWVLLFILRNFPQIRRKRKEVLTNCVVSPKQLKTFKQGSIAMLVLKGLTSKMHLRLGKS